MAVCKNCPDRHQGCHAECEDYQAERRKRDEYNEIRLKKNTVTQALIENTISTMRRGGRKK